MVQKKLCLKKKNKIKQEAYTVGEFVALFWNDFFSKFKCNIPNKYEICLCKQSGLRNSGRSAALSRTFGHLSSLFRHPIMSCFGYTDVFIILKVVNCS